MKASLNQSMKFLLLTTLLMTGYGLMMSHSAYALDSIQKDVMNKAITGKSGKVGISSSSLKGSTSKTTSYTDAVKGVRFAITLVIAGLYFLFVAWLAKSQYVAWAEGDIDSSEGFGSVVIATLMLLLIVFILTT